MEGGGSGSSSLVLHQDARDSAWQAASWSVDQLLWQCSADIAKAVTMFGPGFVALPLFGRVSGVSGRQCLAYEAHPKRVAKGGLMDRVDFETKFGQMDPARLMEELSHGQAGLDSRLKLLSNAELRDEVLALQDWRTQANGRLKTLEKRAAWAFLGIPAGSADQQAIKRAFKRKALELHPDKGGDPERFRLLQEMKSLLVAARNQAPEGLSAQQKEQDDKAQTKVAQNDPNQGAEEGEGDDESAGFSSDDSWDADEEFRKMFPKRNRRKRHDRNGDDVQDTIQVDEEFDRARHEAARRKLHRTFTEMWDRTSQLAQEIDCSQAMQSASETLQQLRRFVDRFASSEVSKLQENDPQKAERIFRRFLEQGSEVLCAAGAADPASTISCVAMQLNYPLLAVSPSDSLKARCAALLDAISSLSSDVRQHVAPVEKQMTERRRTAKAAAATAQGLPLSVRLLVPDPEAVAHVGGAEMPGIIEVTVELPPGSVISDLRAAALQNCGGHRFGACLPRLFSEGRFLGGAATNPLTDFEALRNGRPVHCLPSNSVAMPRRRPMAATVQQRSSGDANSGVGAELPSQELAAVPACSRPRLPKVGKPVSEDPCAGVPMNPAEADGDAAGAVAGTAAAIMAAAGVAAAGSQQHNSELRPDPQLPAGGECDASVGATAQASSPEPAGAAFADDHDDEDAFFDNFFSKPQAAPEPAKAPSPTQQGRSALEARLLAQKQAAEAKRKLEKERKVRAAEAKKKGHGTSAVTLVAQGEEGKMSEATHAAPRALVARKEDVTADLNVCRRKQCWDSAWDHPCAGEKRQDGSAIFCHPCNEWFLVGEPFDHRDFELHCESIGHYGWID